MSGELGLFNNFRETVYEPLQSFLIGDSTRPGREVRVEEFMQKFAPNPLKPGSYGLTNSDNNPLTLDDLFQDLAQDPRHMTLNNLVSISGDVRYLAPAMVRDFIVEGLESNARYKDLINQSLPSALSVTSPWIQYEDAKPEAVGEAERIPVSKISWGEKHVRITKKAIGLETTDEIVMACPLNLLGQYLGEVGVELSDELFTNGVICLINGDQAGGADSCAVIGVTTQGAWAFKDFVRPWARGSRINVNYLNMLSNEVTANDVLEITEFKQEQGVGGKVVNIDTNKIIPSSMKHRISEQFTDDQILFYDTRAMNELVGRPVMIEHERIIMRQINGTAVSIIQGFTTMKRIHRVIVNKSLAFAANGFPTWMTPRT